jgi:hypothetical protein
VISIRSLRTHNILLHRRRGTLPPRPGSKGAGPSDKGDVHPRTRSCAIHDNNKAGTPRSPLYHEHSSTATCNGPRTSKTKRESRSTIAEHEEAERSTRISTAPPTEPLPPWQLSPATPPTPAGASKKGSDARSAAAGQSETDLGFHPGQG